MSLSAASPGKGASGRRAAGAMSPAERAWWSIVQWAVLAGGVALLVLLLVRPAVGLVALWDVLIAAAPALLVFAPGLWRNICPLGTVSQLGRRTHTGLRLRLSAGAQTGAGVAALLLLLVLVPARHLGLDDTGAASATLLVVAGLCALVAGLVFQGKSAWCSGLCPVRPVEQLYGSRPAITLKNAHCIECERCVEPCPDSTPAMTPATGGGKVRALAGRVLIGGFPGFVLGWFEAPRIGGRAASADILNAYGWPWGMMALSAALYLVLRAGLGAAGRGTLLRAFAAAAVSLYYWYKLPPALGLGGSGTVLVDLGTVAPAWTIWMVRMVTTAGLVWWMVPARPRKPRRSWLYRPPFAGTMTPLTVTPAGATAAHTTH